MNVIERLRAADPVPDTEPVGETDLAAVVAAARNTKANGRTAPRRPVSRRLLLGGVAAATVGTTIAVASSLARQESAYAAKLRKLATEVSAAPPPDADVLYAKWRSMAIHTAGLEPGLNSSIEQVARTRTTSTIEEWHPLWPLKYRPIRTEHTTSEYLTPGDADRAARLAPKDRRINDLPPEGGSWSDTAPLRDYPAEPPGFRSPTPEFVHDLPTDPAALLARIEATPEFDRFHDLYWYELWDRLVRWEEVKDFRLGGILLGLLQFVPTPPPVRAAAIELLAEVRSIVVYGNRTVRGRTGLAVGYDSEPPADAMVIDRTTGLIIHERSTLTEQDLADWSEMADQPAGTVHHSRTLVELAYVPKVRVTP